MKTRNQKLEMRNQKLEMTNENKQFKKNNIVKEEPKEIKSPNWFDKNKFKEILAIIDSNKFNYKNKIGEFKYIDIKDLVNNIRNNTISEIDAKKHFNTLNIIKKSEIKRKRLIPGQKELLYLFDLLDTILTDKTLISSKDKKEKLKEGNGNQNNNENENENENDDDIMKILIHSNDYDEETMDQNKKKIKQ